MVWLEDPLTGDAPHRTVVEEEDEERAQELAPQYSATPTIQWTSENANVKQSIMVFLLGQAACLLAGTSLSNMQVVGNITVPELVRVKSPLEEEYGSSQQPVHKCSLSVLTNSSSANQPPLLVVQCPRELPAEQAVAWVQGVVPALQPSAAVIATTLAAMNYRGPGSPADEDLVFSLRTSTAERSATGLPPPLPPATLVGGLPAALLTHFDLQNQPATLVVGVQVQQVPDAQFMYHLSQGLLAATQAVGGKPAAAALAQQQLKPKLLAALRTATDSVYRSSASSSIFS